MTAIATHRLTKRFGDVTAVEDLDLTVERGEVFGFLGPNGAGKSTTINALLGFLTPTSGTVRVLGEDVAEAGTRIRQRTGLLPEGYEPYPNLTGREHVCSAIDAKGADDDPDHLLERVGLDPGDARRPAKGYSTGMRQRVSLAVALVGDPDLLILDEPSSGLDPGGVTRLREIVRTEADRGATVFFSSHVLEEVEKVCDRVGILEGGRLAAVDTVDELRADLQAGATVSATLDVVPSGPGADELSFDGVTGVADVAVDGRTAEVTCTDARAKVDAIRRLDDVATVADVRIEEASLETVFDAFTGRRDESAAGSDGATDDPGAADAVADGDSVAADGGDRA